MQTERESITRDVERVSLERDAALLFSDLVQRHGPEDAAAIAARIASEIAADRAAARAQFAQFAARRTEASTAMASNAASIARRNAVRHHLNNRCARDPNGRMRAGNLHAEFMAAANDETIAASDPRLFHAAMRELGFEHWVTKFGNEWRGIRPRRPGDDPVFAADDFEPEARRKRKRPYDPIAEVTARDSVARWTAELADIRAASEVARENEYRAMCEAIDSGQYWNPYQFRLLASDILGDIASEMNCILLCDFDPDNEQFVAPTAMPELRRLLRFAKDITETPTRPNWFIDLSDVPPETWWTPERLPDEAVIDLDARAVRDPRASHAVSAAVGM